MDEIKTDACCKNCIYFNPTKETEPLPGQCRRNAPDINWRIYKNGDASGGASPWPEVMWNEWCGEWRRHYYHVDKKEVVKVSAEDWVREEVANANQ